MVASIDETQWSDGVVSELRERGWFGIKGTLAQHA